MLVLVLPPLLLVLQAALGSGRTLSELRETELERYALLMLDPAAFSDPIPAGPVTRRITPKSVFIAPPIKGNQSADQCAEGYKQDDMGRCVKVVEVNYEKSWDLLLNKLNNQFPSDMDSGPEPTPPPGPPPGPLQVNIPIAEGPVVEPDVLFSAPPSPSSSSPRPPHFAADAVTTPSVDETTTVAVVVVTERDWVENAADAPQDEVPEVVMVSSEERLQPPVPLVGGADSEGEDGAAEATTTDANAMAGEANETNPIINTVNSSPLVAESVPEQRPPLGPMSMSSPPPSPDTTTRSSPTPSSSTWEAVPSSTAPPAPSTSTVTSRVESSSPTTLERNYTTAEPRLPSSTSAESSPVLVSSSTMATTSTTSYSSSSSSSQSSEGEEKGERQGPVDNRLRPAASRIPAAAAAPPETVRFPTEKPTLFRTATGHVRFPTIDVTFPTGSGGAPRPDPNWLRPVKFPKDDSSLSLWRLPPPPSPASNWSLEQTRNKPYLFRYWSRSPSRLSPASFSDSLGGSSSSGRDSVESGSGQLPPSVWPPRQHTGNSFEFRRSSASYNSHPHSTQSHRRGRNW